MTKKILNFICHFPQLIKFSIYVKNYKKNDVKEDTYILEYNDKIKKIIKNIDSKEIYVVYKNKIELDSIRKLNLNIKSVKYNSNKYYKLLSFCKYLFFNCDITNKYIKKDDQIIINYYNEYDFLTTQRSILLSDIILVNKKDSNILKKYMLEDLYSGKLVFLEENKDKEVVSLITNYKYKEKKHNKKNILTYCGKFVKNGLTSSYFNLMNRVDRDKFNIIANFDNSLYDNNEYAINLFRQNNILELPMYSEKIYSLRSLFVYFIYRKFNKINSKYQKCLDEMIDIEIRRLYGNTHFDAVINFSGYDSLMIMLYEKMDAFSMIFIHNNIVEELKNKKSRHYLTMKSALKNYDKVMLVSEGIYEPTLEIAEDDNNFLIMNNICNYEEIIENSKKDVVFDNDTYCNIELSKLNEILDSSSIKFINIGRFTYEKNQIVLIEQFEKFYNHNNDSYLIIVGGYGDWFDIILDKVNKSVAKDNIIIIKSINNPMPILKKCTAFVLYSIYEAFPMTLMEADSLSIPLIISNCKGPYAFWKKHNAKIIDINNPKELYESLLEVEKNKIPAINIDYKIYNQKWIKYFEDNLLDGISSYRRKK